MKTIVESFDLPLGYEMDIEDPHTWDKVTVRVIECTYDEEGQYSSIVAEVLRGWKPGRVVRGYIDKSGPPLDRKIYAYLIENDDIDTVERDLWLHTSGRLYGVGDTERREIVADLEHILALRAALTARRWDPDFLQRNIRRHNRNHRQNAPIITYADDSIVYVTAAAQVDKVEHVLRQKLEDAAACNERAS